MENYTNQEPTIYSKNGTDFAILYTLKGGSIIDINEQDAKNLISLGEARNATIDDIKNILGEQSGKPYLELMGYEFPETPSEPEEELPNFDFTKTFSDWSKADLLAYLKEVNPATTKTSKDTKSDILDEVMQFAG